MSNPTRLAEPSPILDGYVAYEPELWWANPSLGSQVLGTANGKSHQELNTTSTNYRARELKSLEIGHITCFPFGHFLGNKFIQVVCVVVVKFVHTSLCSI